MSARRRMTLNDSSIEEPPGWVTLDFTATPAFHDFPPMRDFAEKFLQAFIPMFVAVDPVGLAAIFLGLGQGVAAKQRQLIGRQATVTGGAVALIFLFLGANIFKAVGISPGDFQIAGGLILFILATRELIPSAAEPQKMPRDFGVVPLGMPLIAGPALITTLIAMAQSLGIAIALSA